LQLWPVEQIGHLFAFCYTLSSVKQSHVCKIEKIIKAGLSNWPSVSVFLSAVKSLFLQMKELLLGGPNKLVVFSHFVMKTVELILFF